MAPAQAVEGSHLEEARSALVATKPVAQVDSSQQLGVEIADSRTRRLVRLVREVCVAFNGQTEDWSEVTTNTQTCIRVEVVGPSVDTSCLGGHTTVDSDVEIVEGLAFCNRLGVYRCCHHSCGSK